MKTLGVPSGSSTFDLAGREPGTVLVGGPHREPPGHRSEMVNDGPRRPRPVLGTLLYGLVILAVALAFQGSRGLFEPDEGRYADIALGMLRSGDWWTPRLQGLIYLDKPPAFYWSVAAGIELLGAGEWGARLGQALAFVATALLVGAWSGRAWGEKLGRLCGAAYATTLLPIVATNILTPDTLLTLWTTASSFSYWGHRGARSARERWLWALALGCSTGLGLATKGTAALVFLAPAAVHLAWEKRPLRFVRRTEVWAAALLGAAIGSFWYVEISLRLPTAAQYFYDNQVAGRLWRDGYHRNPDWWAPFEIYGGVLALGSLPWTLTWLGLRRSANRRSRWRAFWDDELVRYLALATAVPLVVFSLASSKLPLYILPVFPYLVMATIWFAARQERHPHWGHRVLLAMLAVVALKGFGALVPSHRDIRALARELDHAGVESTECIVALELNAHGLSLYGYPRVSWQTIWPEDYPYFEAPRTLADDLTPLLERCDHHLRLLVLPKRRDAVRDLVSALQLECRDQALSWPARLLSCARSAADPTPTSGQAP